MAPLPSVAVIVKLLVPALPGVPDNTPLPGFRVKPVGSVPALTLNVYEPFPPLAVTVCE
jgi:hypothetical protein